MTGMSSREQDLLARATDAESDLDYMRALAFRLSWERMCLFAGIDAIVRRADTDKARGTVSGCSIVARAVFAQTFSAFPDERYIPAENITENSQQEFRPSHEHGGS